SQRRGADDFPLVTPVDRGDFLRVDRGDRAVQFLQILEPFPGRGRRVHEQYTAGLDAGVLPGMRYAARHEGAGAGAADRHRVADLERDLAGEDVGDLVAVVVDVIAGRGAGGRRLLEHHDAVAGLAALQFERGRAPRRHVQYRPLARRHDDALAVG